MGRWVIMEKIGENAYREVVRFYDYEAAHAVILETPHSMILMDGGEILPIPRQPPTTKETEVDGQDIQPFDTSGRLKISPFTLRAVMRENNVLQLWGNIRARDEEYKLHAVVYEWEKIARDDEYCFWVDFDGRPPGEKTREVIRQLVNHIVRTRFSDILTANEVEKARAEYAFDDAYAALREFQRKLKELQRANARVV
jgi:hypothetical protein